MRVGVAGVGRIGRLHARVLTEHPKVTSVAVTDVDSSRADEVASSLGAEPVKSFAELIGRVDAVVIATTTTSHAELIQAAVDAGVPAYCEKPIATDLDSTREVVERVQASAVPVQMGFQRRFDPGYRAAAELVASGGLGTLYTVRTAGHDPEPPWEDYIAHSGGIFQDFGVHDFDALRFVTGQEIREVYAQGAVRGFPIFETYGDVDTATATLVLSDGALGIMSIARHDPLGYDIRMELHGSKDSVVVGWDGRTPLRSVEPGIEPSKERPYENFPDRFRSAYQAALSAFLEVARGRRESPCTVTDAVEALRVAVACDISRRDHRPVTLTEIR
jgi:myo-inositol 2-dehydrogenase/D-chiro-inositol 1-dehydrogenase